ncbi:DUF4279 domain-containing protein [Pseudoxanthomonas sacheonensis]|uniref:DUF4279 domain-containing protein n=1 Tax=Pseudoxanthomonas sacheonensis TaxID=443615 RepID=A0ABU1RQZ2_9GAMM|nr:DUF4279 domain-containing protein [Pseudoxanthomonas sacheonensis]MDR6841193.1 hypothetical protein [Pseudoxanthomonas sacheonensis]
MTGYDKNYATCSYTHVWFRAMHDTADPSEATKILGIEPTSSHLVGSRVSEKSTRTRKSSGWFLESAGNVDSLDARHHLDWLLDKMVGKEAAISQLLQQGYFVDICCRWDSQSGQGGPTMDPSHMKALGKLGVEFWFDIYFDGEGIAGA